MGSPVKLVKTTMSLVVALVDVKPDFMTMDRNVWAAEVFAQYVLIAKHAQPVPATIKFQAASVDALMELIMMALNVKTAQIRIAKPVMQVDALHAIVHFWLIINNVCALTDFIEVMLHVFLVVVYAPNVPVVIVLALAVSAITSFL